MSQVQTPQELYSLIRSERFHDSYREGDLGLFDFMLTTVARGHRNGNFILGQGVSYAYSDQDTAEFRAIVKHLGLPAYMQSNKLRYISQNREPDGFNNDVQDVKRHGVEGKIINNEDLYVTRPPISHTKFKENVNILLRYLTETPPYNQLLVKNLNELREKDYYDEVNKKKDWLKDPNHEKWQEQYEITPVEKVKPVCYSPANDAKARQTLYPITLELKTRAEWTKNGEKWGGTAGLVVGVGTAIAATAIGGPAIIGAITETPLLAMTAIPGKALMGTAAVALIAGVAVYETGTYVGSKSADWSAQKYTDLMLNYTAWKDDVGKAAAATAAATPDALKCQNLPRITGAKRYDGVTPG